MCGRYTVRTNVRKLAEKFKAELSEAARDALLPRFNVTPTTPVPVVTVASATRQLTMMRWGLVPHWAKDQSAGVQLINARGDTVAEKCAFKDAFKRRRCLMVADGFYEWRTLGREKLPSFFRMADDEPFAFAAMWDRWQADGHTIDTCALITTDANELVATVHDRMPVIIDPIHYDRWMDPANTTGEGLAALLRPHPADGMMADAVSSYVSKAGNEGPKCIEPAEDGALF